MQKADAFYPAVAVNHERYRDLAFQNAESFAGPFPGGPGRPYDHGFDVGLRGTRALMFGRFTSRQLRVATEVSAQSIEPRSGMKTAGLAGLDATAGEAEDPEDSDPKYR